MKQCHESQRRVLPIPPLAYSIAWNISSLFDYEIGTRDHELV